MIIHRYGLALFASCLVLLTSSVLRAQTIDITSVSESGFCAGDPVSVGFTVTGDWGHKNAFTLQLSNPTGSFSSGFLNIGSIFDTVAGSFTIVSAIPTNAVSSASYRFRIIGAVPYVESTDNGSDVSIHAKPGPISISFPQGMTGTAIPLAARAHDTDAVEPTDSIYWDLGMDATPATISGTWANNSNVTVAYSTGGPKTVTATITNAAGCSITASQSTNVLDCYPAIPHDAIVIDHDQHWGSGSTTIWINPGITVQCGGGSNTIFVESGATLTLTSGSNYVYLKRGAVCLSGGGGDNIFIYADGAAIPAGFSGHKCASLDFDYTNAPPNKAVPFNAVESDVLSHVTVSPNPVAAIITVDGLVARSSVTVLNVLGTVVREASTSDQPSLSFSIGDLPAGSYYVRIASQSQVATHKILKE